MKTIQQNNIDTNFQSQKTLVPELETKWIICRNDPVNRIDPDGRVDFKNGHMSGGDFPMGDIYHPDLNVELTATQEPELVDFAVVISFQTSGGGIWGGNLNAGYGFAFDSDTGNWERGGVATEGAGSFAGGARSYVIEVAVAPYDELSDFDGTTLEIGVSGGEGPGGGASVNIPYPSMDFENMIYAVNFGLSFGFPLEGHCFINETQTNPIEQAPSTNPKQEGTK